MRLIFITLLVVNVLVFGWGVFFSSPDVVANSAPPKHEDRIKTISVNEETEQLPAGEAQKRLCELVGPFADDLNAEVFVERLRSIDIPAGIDHVELPAGASYWVHLPPEETTSSAYKKLAELQALGIESYVIGRGDLRNAVSLGVFSKPALADAKKLELEKEGFEPIITVKPRTEVEIWVVIQSDFAEKMSDLTWARMLEGMTSQERRQNFCLPVASSDNIQ